jgi:hypothetical protein
MVISVGSDLPLLLALAAEVPGVSSGWAAVGLPGLGVLAARHSGLDLSAGAFVDAPGSRWPQVVAHLAGAVPVVLLGSTGTVAGRPAARIGALLRTGGTVLLVAGPWQGADARFRVAATAWEGLGTGHGVLRRRRAQVEVSGRGIDDARPRWTELWLPTAAGPAVPVMEGRTDQAVGGSVVPSLRVVR